MEWRGEASSLSHFAACIFIHSNGCGALAMASHFTAWHWHATLHSLPPPPPPSSSSSSLLPPPLLLLPSLLLLLLLRLLLHLLLLLLLLLLPSGSVSMPTWRTFIRRCQRARMTTMLRVFMTPFATTSLRLGKGGGRMGGRHMCRL